MKRNSLLLLVAIALASSSALTLADEPAPPTQTGARPPAAAARMPVMPAHPEATTQQSRGAQMEATVAAPTATGVKKPAMAKPAGVNGINAMPGEQTQDTSAGSSGEQRAKTVVAPARAIAAESYIQLVMEVSKNGEAKVLSAVTVPGVAPLTDEVRGDFVYSILLNNEILGVQAVPDPFELRAFPPPSDNARDEGKQGHHFEQAQTARVTIVVPKAATVKQRINQLQFKFYKWKPMEHVHTINISSFQKSLKSRELEPVVSIPAQKISPQLKQRLQATQ